MEKQFSSKIFFKYLISYFFIFFIPVVILFIMFNFHYLNVYKEEVFLNNTEQTVKVKNFVEFQLSQLDNLIKQIRLDEEFVTSFNRPEANRVITHKRIKSYAQVNDFIYNIIYFQKDINTAISSNSIITMNTMEKYHFSYDNWPKEDMLSQLYSNKSPFWRTFEPVKFSNNNYMQILTYMYPLTQFKTANPNALMFQIERKAFMEAINLPEENRSLLVIKNKEGDVLFSSINDIVQYEKAMNSINSYNSSGVASREAGDVFVSSAISTYNGWTYYTILPLNMALVKVKDLQTDYLLYTILLFVTGILLVYYISYKNYSPLRSLLNYIESHFKPQGKWNNEIDAAKNAIHYLSESRINMEERIKNSSCYVKASLLQNLMHGYYEKIEDFNEEGKEYGLEYPNGYFFIVIIDSERDISQISEFENSIEGFKALRADNPDLSHVILICCINVEDISIVTKELKSLADRIYGKFDFRIKMGVSNFTNDTTQLYRKYIEALNAFENIASYISKNVNVFGGNSHNFSTQYPAKDIDNIKISLMKKDVKQFKTYMALLFNYVNGARTNMFLKVCICYDIVNAIIRTMLSIDKGSLPKLHQYNIILSNGNNSLDNLCDLLDKLGQDVTNYLMENEEYIEKSLLDEIYDYINKNMFEYDFCVQKIASHFGMSISNLSHYFKNNSGRTISNYISELKMSYAMELLRDSEVSMQYIIERTGYTNMSSFIRKFKTHTGVTPGEYRNAHQNGNL